MSDGRISEEPVLGRRLDDGRDGPRERAGEDLRKLSDGQIARWRNANIGFVFQSFNLIPVLPLDGGNIVLTVLPPNIAYRYAASRSYGMLILYALMLTGAISYLLGPPYYFLRSVLR